MKKLAAVLMMAGMLLVTGCGNDEKVIDGNVQNQGSSNVQADSQGSQTAQAKGYVFVSGGVTIGVDVDAAPIIEKLGEPDSYYEAASCAFEGLDKMYTYKGFEIDTYPNGDADYVSAVIFKNDSVKTPEGVGLGDTAEAVEKAYGNNAVEAAEKAGAVNGTLEYEKDGMKLCFIVKDDEVVSVEYRSTVLDN